MEDIKFEVILCIYLSVCPGTNTSVTVQMRSAWIFLHNGRDIADVSSPTLVAISLAVSKYGIKMVFGQFARRIRNIDKIHLMRCAAAFVYSASSTAHKCYNLRPTLHRLSVDDTWRPSSDRRQSQIFVKNRDFFITHVHSTPALILTVLSRRRGIQSQTLPLKRGPGVAYSFYCTSRLADVRLVTHLNHVFS